ncbi:hypothetical protein C9421_30215, partial [Klebsiella pneumoniae]
QFSRREDEQMTAFREFVLREGERPLLARRLSMRCTYGMEQFSRREDEQMTAFREFVLREGERPLLARRLSM